MPLDLRALENQVSSQQEKLRILSGQNKHLLRQHSALWEFHGNLLRQHRALCRCLCRTGFLSRIDLLMEMQGHPPSQRLLEAFDDPSDSLPYSTSGCKLFGESSCYSEGVTEAPSEQVSVGSTEDRESGEGLSPVRTLRRSSSLEGFEAYRVEGEEAEEDGGSLGGWDGEESWLALLREVWQYSVLADALGSSMGVAGVLRFREVSRAGRECMRTVHARILLWEPSLASTLGLGLSLDHLSGPALMQRRRSVHEDVAPASCGLLMVLQDAWQYSPLAEELAGAMDDGSLQRFESVSRAGCECVRLACAARLLRRKSQEDSQRRRSSVLALQEAQLQQARRKALPEAGRQQAPPLPAGALRACPGGLLGRGPICRGAVGATAAAAAAAAAGRRQTPLRRGTVSGICSQASTPAGASRPSTPARTSRPSTPAGASRPSTPAGASRFSCASRPRTPTGLQRCLFSPAARHESAPVLPKGGGVARSEPAAAVPKEGGSAEGRRGRLVRLWAVKQRPELDGEVGRLMRCTEWSNNWLIVLKDGRSVCARPDNVEFLEGGKQGGAAAARGLQARRMEEAETPSPPGTPRRVSAAS